MNQSQTKSITFAKVFVILAAALGVGIGLCGLDYFLASKGIGKSTEEFGVGPLDGVSLMVMLLSALALVITTLAWAVSAIVGSLSRESSDPQKLFGDSNDPDKKS